MKIRIHLLQALIVALLAHTCLTAAGGQPLPFSTTFNTPEELSAWQIADIDGDGLTWQTGKPDYGQDMAKSTAAYSAFGDTDNRLISPALSLPAGKDLSLKFKFFTSYYITELLDIYISPSPLTSADTADATLVASLSLRDYYGKNQALLIPALEAEGDYYLTFRHHASEANNFGFVLYLTDLNVDVMKDGNMEGTVNGTSGPLAGANVSIAGTVTKSCTTDNEGHFSFEGIPSGSYDVEFSAFGYSTTKRIFDVEADRTTDASVTLYEMGKAKVSGAVTDSEGTPLEGAQVTLEGYTTYRTSTDAQGKYELSGVYLYDYYGGSKYNISIQRNNFKPAAAKQISLYYDYNAGTTRLDYDNLPPYTVTCQPDGDRTLVSWQRPVTTTWLKYDNNNPSSPLGYDQGLYENILGTIYREAMAVSDFEWFTLDTNGGVDKITIYLISLDSEGNPTGEIVFQAKDIPNTPGQWNRHHLDTPVECANGFLMAMSGRGNICLAKDDSQDVVPRTQLYSNTYNSPDAYRYFEEVGWTGALCLRAGGEKLQPEMALKLKYDLFRLEKADADNPANWTELAKNTTETSFTDNNFTSLPRGSYQYAVKAVYDISGETSPSTLSSVLHHLQHTALAVNVTTNADPADAEGATATLSRQGMTPLSATVIDGKVAFADLWKDHAYTLTIAQPGFELYKTDLDLDALDAFDAFEVSASLAQILAPVNNIDVEGLDTDTPSLLFDMFPDIYESFEGDDFADFEINPAGKLGWQYYDGDWMPTYQFNVSTFPGIGSRMAAVILDSSKTEPELSRSVANTGTRALGFFCPATTIDEGGNEVSHKADDWLISPLLSYHRDFTVTFAAKTWESQDGRVENVRLGYSTTGSDPADFEFLGPKNGHDVPLDYTEYTYTVPRDAKYVAIQSRSDDVFLLCIDDIRFESGCTQSGEEPSAGHFSGYEVSIDGAEPTATSTNRFPLVGLEKGLHTAEVTKVYRSGKSRPLSLEFTIERSGVSEVNHASAFAIVFNGSLVATTTESRTIEIFTPEGRLAAKADNTDKLSVAALSTGIYIVRATNGEGNTATTRIVVR